jgi:hypothetical protein
MIYKRNIAMKKLLFISIFCYCVLLSAKGQTVANYSYVLDNGINVRVERGWNHVWVQQAFDVLKEGDKGDPIDVVIRVLGDLKSSSSFKLLSQGKEVRTAGAAPGTYDLKLSFKLSGKPGTLSFIVNNVIIKPKTKTTLTVTIYDYQVNIAEAPGTLKGLSGYESSVISYNGSVDTKPNTGVFTFYAKGKHDAKITPDEATSDIKGKIKPGTYDVLITIGISGQKHDLWLENFTLKQDVNYKIVANLNAGVVIYTGGNKEVRSLHMYPAGTSAKQTGKPAPDKTKEIIIHESVGITNPCAPGSYDVLLEFGKGAKYEWRKVSVQSKQRADIK